MTRISGGPATKRPSPLMIKLRIAETGALERFVREFFKICVGYTARRQKILVAVDEVSGQAYLGRFFEFRGKGVLPSEACSPK